MQQRAWERGSRRGRFNSRRPTEKDRNDRHQTVAGMVVFRKTEEGPKFLLLYRRGTYWNFPKGHYESGENSLAAAYREIQEETGLSSKQLRIHPEWGARQRFSFTAEGERIHDTVILYLVETDESQIRIVPREHNGYAWFLYRDALKHLSPKYAETKRILKQASDYIRLLDNPTAAGEGGQYRPPRRPARRVWNHPPKSNNANNAPKSPAV